MSLFYYTGPMTTDDIFADVYRRGRKISCRDRMCGAEDCDNCRPGNQDSDDRNDKDDEKAND